MRPTLAIVALSAVLLSACQVKLDQSTVVNEDGSGSLAVVIAVDEEVQEFLGATGQDLRSAAEGLPAGFTTSEFREGDLTGVRAEVEFADLAELNELLSGELGGGQVADAVSIVRDGDVFVFQAAMGNIGEQLSGFQGAEAALTPDLFDDIFDITIRTKLPGEVIDHNADALETDGSLTWTIGSASSGDLFAESSVAPGVSMALMMVAVGGVAALALGAALLLSRRSGGTRSSIG